MTIIGLLIVAHLLGDFTLQTFKLVSWKKKSHWGLLVHILVHFLSASLLLLPIMLQGHASLIYLPILVSFVHYFIDQTKIKYSKNNEHRILVPFLIDQCAHLLTILLATFPIIHWDLTLPKSSFNSLYTNPQIIIYLIGMILSGKAIEIIIFQKQLEKNPKAKLEISFNLIVIRLLTFTIFYWSSVCLLKTIF